MLKERKGTKRKDRGRVWLGLKKGLLRFLLLEILKSLLSSFGYYKFQSAFSKERKLISTFERSEHWPTSQSKWDFLTFARCKRNHNGKYCGNGPFFNSLSFFFFHPLSLSLSFTLYAAISFPFPRDQPSLFPFYSRGKEALPLFFAQ